MVIGVLLYEVFLVQKATAKLELPRVSNSRSVGNESSASVTRQYIIVTNISKWGMSLWFGGQHTCLLVGIQADVRSVPGVDFTNWLTHNCKPMLNYVYSHAIWVPNKTLEE